MCLLTRKSSTDTAPTATSSVYNKDVSCWHVSIEHDAISCAKELICSGSTTATVSPTQLIAECLPNLFSHTSSDTCVLALHQTGAWGECHLWRQGRIRRRRQRHHQR